MIICDEMTQIQIMVPLKLERTVDIWGRQLNKLSDKTIATFKDDSAAGKVRYREPPVDVLLSHPQTVILPLTVCPLEL